MKVKNVVLSCMWWNCVVVIFNNELQSWKKFFKKKWKNYFVAQCGWRFISNFFLNIVSFRSNAKYAKTKRKTQINNGRQQLKWIWIKNLFFFCVNKVHSYFIFQFMSQMKWRMFFYMYEIYSYFLTMVLSYIFFWRACARIDCIHLKTIRWSAYYRNKRKQTQISAWMYALWIIYIELVASRPWQRRFWNYEHSNVQYN